MVNIDKIKSLAKEKGVSITFLCQAIGQGAYYFNDVKRRNGSIPDDRLESSAQNANTKLEITTRYIILTSYLHSAFSVL